MASSKSTSQRLLKELKEYASNPNEALLHLGPVSDEDLLQWEAVLRGVQGTPYEGKKHHHHHHHSFCFLFLFLTHN
jgi:peroxin-4